MQCQRDDEAYACLAGITHWFEEGFATTELQEAKRLLEISSCLRKKERHLLKTAYLESAATVDTMG